MDNFSHQYSQSIPHGVKLPKKLDRVYCLLIKIRGYAMAKEPGPDLTKKQLNVRLDPETIECLDYLTSLLKYKNRPHAIEMALDALYKEESERDSVFSKIIVPPTSREFEQINALIAEYLDTRAEKLARTKAEIIATAIRFLYGIEKTQFENSEE